MAFRFPPALPSSVSERPRLGSHSKPGIRLSGMQQGFGKTRQEISPIESYTRRLYGRPTLLHLLQTLCSASLPGERYAAYERAACPPEWHLERSRQDHRRLGQLLRCRGRAAQHMEIRHQGLAPHQNVRVRQALCLHESFLTVCQSLVRIAEAPQHPGRKDVAANPGVMDNPGRGGGWHILAGHPLLQVDERCIKLA